jgi:hypothetical protein
MQNAIFAVVMWVANVALTGGDWANDWRTHWVPLRLLTDMLTGADPTLRKGEFGWWWLAWLLARLRDAVLMG